MKHRIGETHHRVKHSGVPHAADAPSRFVSRDHDYVVYTAIGKDWGEKAGVAVERFGAVIANPKCDDAPTSELGSQFFGQAGIVEDDQPFELPE